MKQPKNKKITVQTGSAKMQCSLVWNQSFSRNRAENFSEAQKFIDKSCIQLSKKYTPARNLFLSERAPFIGTKIGSGHICYKAPYARYQYYGVLMVSSVTGSAYARHGESKVITGKPLQYDKDKHQDAQRLWFEVMKTNYKAEILQGAAQKAGGKAK